ncbi:alpha-1 2-Mannosidase [Fasciola gigantica]|uniref:alpha-1,2-Mannosidase n=1 Tax=Fasciola gigantica TaxID=46835 RepID=A0A504YJA4_FASGI|nr:alpha-1 2-Mannosidase [Fasciola gigantica]
MISWKLCHLMANKRLLIILGNLKSLAFRVTTHLMTIESILKAAKRAYQKCLRSSRLPKVQIFGRKNIYASLVSLILCGGIYSFWKDSGKPLNSLSNSTNEQTDPPKIIFNELPDNRMSRVIKDAMVHSWKAYRMYAWGMDVTNPIKLSGSEWMGAALTMIDSLDTLWIMGLTKEFDDARGWIAANLTFNKNNDHINLFETTIRVLGGLLSAYHLSEDDLFLQKANELGSLLLVAFHSSSSFPLPDLNFAHRTAHHSPQYREACLSEMAVQLEFNQLSILTNDVRFAASIY